ncbi:Uncharacterised protein [uncultured archaeon]|nr:Uncharacterised protein [uncultured archaeon]
MDLSRHDFLKAKLLFKLARTERYGGKHVSLDTLKHGFKPHEKGEVDEIIEELIAERWLLEKPAHYGRQVMLNVEYSKGIKSFIRERLSNIPPFSELLKWMK